MDALRIDGASAQTADYPKRIVARGAGTMRIVKFPGNPRNSRFFLLGVEFESSALWTERRSSYRPSPA
jgi:hypothetical protein